MILFSQTVSQSLSKAAESSALPELFLDSSISRLIFLRMLVIMVLRLAKYGLVSVSSPGGMFMNMSKHAIALGRRPQNGLINKRVNVRWS